MQNHLTPFQHQTKLQKLAVSLHSIFQDKNFNYGRKCFVQKCYPDTAPSQKAAWFEKLTSHTDRIMYSFVAGLFLAVISKIVLIAGFSIASNIIPVAIFLVSLLPLVILLIGAMYYEFQDERQLSQLRKDYGLDHAYDLQDAFEQNPKFLHLGPKWDEIKQITQLVVTHEEQRSRILDLIELTHNHTEILRRYNDKPKNHFSTVRDELYKIVEQSSYYHELTSEDRMKLNEKITEFKKDYLTQDVDLAHETRNQMMQKM